MLLLRTAMGPMQASSLPSTIKARALARVATTSALGSVAIAALLWASPSRALPFTSTPTWNFLNPSPASYDYFGSSVALSGNNALIGAYGENTASGAAYLYASTSSSPPTQAQSVPGPLPLLGLGAAFAWSRRLRNKYRNAAQAGGRNP
jgi:MYXO-CTERM domain-containing protein